MQKNPGKIDPGTGQYRGLRSVCKNAPTCTHQRNHEKFVLQCEEFEEWHKPPVKSAPENVLRAVNPVPEKSTGDKEESKYIGICKSCKYRKTCTYPELEAGI
ncbi:MAG: hypothetical protein J7M18_02675 [Candidatus Eremiobacteraeota bacterium]|nr:hypothetical protein [Candidatus Eremiobacteraeota bacterium]